MNENQALERVSVASVVVLLSTLTPVGEAKQATVLERFEAMMENSSDAEIKDTIRGQNADEKKAGKQNPVVEGLLQQGWTKESAQTRFSEISKLAKAYLPFNGYRWTPKGRITMQADGSTKLVAHPEPIKGFNAAVTAARKELSSRGVVRKADKQDTAVAIAIVKEQRRVAIESGKTLGDLSPEEAAAARDEALKNIDHDVRQDKVDKAAEVAFNKVGPENIPMLIQALQVMLQEYQTEQSTSPAQIDAPKQRAEMKQAA